MTYKTKKQKITNSRDVAAILYAILDAEEFVDRDKEHFWTIGFDIKNRIKYIELVSLGCLTSTITHPRETFRFAIMQGVASIIIAHNHPSGDKTPSDIDKVFTGRLKQAGEILGIPLLDHIILGHDEHYSFADHNEI